MAIRTKLTTGTIAVLAGDTVILDTEDRIAVSAMSCFSTATVTVSLYSSPDLTSASGTLIANYAVTADTEADIGALIGLGFTENIIAVGDVTGANITMAYTQYTGDDV